LGKLASFVNICNSMYFVFLLSDGFG